ncbi:hypothetical protein SLS60_006043 [Paraconiothyrium brasiliense]|uniref:J domain-containing protein n=1 Tax=Paraconiothyrium brasiliense TaxID=300254 RepID=A0ABR3RE00_9PLEO
MDIEAYHRLAKLHHPAENRSNSDGGACEFHKAQEAYEKLYDTVSRAQYDEEMREKIDDAEARPFNVFNPRPRLSSPINTPRRTSPSTKPLANPNVKFHDIGSEFEEEQPEFANAYRNKGRRNDSQGYTA